MLRISGRWHIALNSWYDCRKRLFFPPVWRQEILLSPIRKPLD